MRFIILIAFICASTTLNAQKSTDFLKHLPVQDENIPAWAQEMYGENPNVQLIDRLYDEFYEAGIFEKTVHTQNYKQWRRAVEPYVNAFGYLEFPSMEEINKKQQRILSKKQLLNRSESEWTAIGPMDTYSLGADQVEVSWQANVYAIDQSISNPSVVYVGTEAGGIFKSENKGDTWESASSSYPISSVTSIEVHPANADIVYAGDNAQLIKTTDGGITWTQLIAVAGLVVNDIAISRSNPEVVMFASTNGFYRSTDGGENWEKLFTNRVLDIEFNPQDDQQVYALVSNLTENRSEFWKSTDGGLSFESKENGWYNSTDPDRFEGGARMTVTPADPNRIYVILIGQSKPGDNGFIGIYRSDDAGESWRNPNPPDGGPYDDQHPNLVTLNNTNTLQQGYYNLSIAASHEDPDQFLIGALNLWNSRDGGVSFEAKGGYQGNVSWIHPDQQEIIINGTDMWVANDGGINYSTDLFESHESKKTGLLASDFWGFGSGWNEDLIVGGRYHNGNTAYRPTFEDGRFLRLGGAEAATGYVSPGQEGVTYFSDINAKNIPYTLDEAVMDVSNLGLFPSESYFASHSSELEFGSNCYNHLWIGRDNGLWKSEDGGNSFELIEDFGSQDQPLMQFEISRVDSKVIYVYQRISFYEARLWVSQDGGENFERKDFPSIMGSMRAGSLQIDSRNPAKLYVAFSHQNNDGEKIFYTENFGDTWNNISDPILDGETIHCMFQHAGTDDLYVGTDYGVFLYDGMEWMTCSIGLPVRFNTNKMAPLYMKNKLRIATYGHGVWETNLRKAVPPIAQATVDKLMSNCVRDTFYFDDYSVLDQEANATWSWKFTPTPAYISDPNARNPKVVFNELGSYSVELTVSNDHGSGTYVEESMIEILDSECTPDIYPGESAVCFNSGNDFVQTGDFDIELEEFTLTAWIKPYNIQGDYTGIIFNDGESFGLNFSTDNQLGFHHPSAGSDAWSWGSGLYVEAYKWSYVALVVRSDGATIYLNGEPSLRPLTLTPVLLSSMKLGSYRGWESRNYAGEIDEVTIWDRALSAEEIRTQKHITKNETNAVGLLAYYQFNEPEGRVLDRLGLNHAGLQGGAERFASNAPIGGGFAATVVDPNLANFRSEEIQMEAELDLEFGEAITFSKINIAPNEPASEEPIVEEVYWIVNKYGDEILGSLKFLNVELEPSLLDDPGSVSLLHRSDNSDFQDWSLVGLSSSVSTTEIIFEEGPVGNAQLSLSETMATSNINLENDGLKVYPNPAQNELNLLLEGEWSFSLLDSKGRTILKDRKIVSYRLQIPEEIENGQYFYILESETEIKTGKVGIFR